MPDYVPYVAPTVETNPQGVLDHARKAIDSIDQALMPLVAERLAVVGSVAVAKEAMGVPVYDPDREEAIFRKLGAAGFHHGVNPEEVRSIYSSLMTIAKDRQEARRASDDTSEATETPSDPKAVLAGAREEIDNIDEKILPLVGERIKVVVGPVTAAKRALDMSVYDPDREAAMFVSLSEMGDGFAIKPDEVRTFYSALMQVAKDRQDAGHPQIKAD